MISFQSVKIRLTVWYAFILTIFLSLFAAFMYLELSRVLYKDSEQALVDQFRHIAESIHPHIAKSLEGARLPEQSQHFQTSAYFSPDVQAKLIAQLESWEDQNKKISRNPRMIRLLGLDKKVIISNVKGWEEEIIFPDFERDSAFMEKGESFQTIHFKKYPILLHYRLVKFRGFPILVMQSGASLQEVRTALRRLALIILFTIPGSVAFACIAGWFLVKRSFLPVDLMIRKARQITGSNLQERLPRSHTGDELDRLAETLNEMMSRIEASTKAIQDFSSDISHEFKTPLAIIRGEIDLAFRKARSTEELNQTLKVIEGEVNEMIRLVDDLILLVRTDAKQIRFEMISVAISQILVSVTERFKERAANKRINLSSDIQPNIVVFGDAVYLKRVFSNLLDNAIKFTAEGGTVKVILFSSPERVTVEVEDTGIGIEIEKQSKVFSRFYRTDSARAQEGSGLGLNIAKAICDAHKATINIKSAPGKGTTVSVIFPLS